MLPTHQLSITELVHHFQATKSLPVLALLAFSIVTQHRTVELLYGGLCSLFHRPSPVHRPDDAEAIDHILGRRAEFAQHAVLYREQLVHAYGDRVALGGLPASFVAVRRESAWEENGRLILGEYGEGARVACITDGACVVNDHYERIPGVRHIHSIQRYGGMGEFLVATGDGHKSLDLWTCSGNEVRFVRTMTKRLAGFTAAAEVGGEYYFGSDFSGRPNFITVLGGPRYFFPKKAYLMHVAAFHVLFDRYLVSVNKELNVSGGRRALSVFDTRTRRFVYCDYMPSCSLHLALDHRSTLPSR
jgi:hypothetical protein